MSEGTDKKKLVSRLDWVFLIVAIVILVSIGMQKCGFHIVQRTDDTEIIQKPHR